MMCKPYGLLLILLISGFFALAQGSTGADRYQTIDQHKLSLFFGSTHIPNGAQDDSGATLIIPNLGINYEYWFDEHFAIGSYNNIHAMSYKINTDNYNDVDKEYPMIFSVVGIFRPWKNLNVVLGPGVEVDKNNTFFVARFGFDYGIRVGRAGWFISPRFLYDNLATDYSAWSFGLDIGKRF
jgi:hypothetical protein